VSVLWTTRRSGETRLPNHVAMLESQAIQSFAAAGHSERAISKSPGVGRGTTTFGDRANRGQVRMALPLLLHDFTATVAKTLANRRPSNPHRVASGSDLSVRAQPQSSPVRGSVGSLTVIVPRWVDLQQGNYSRLALGQVGQFRFNSQRVGQIGYMPVPAISLARAVSRSSVSSARGAGRRLTARGSTRSGRLATRCA
jgi:hypothetical protein